MRTVIFDMDGVLFDTERLCQDSWIVVAGERGLPGMEEVFPRCIGLNANDSRQVVLDAYGRDFDYEGFRKRASQWFWEYVEENGLPMKPGVRELLGWLKENGWTVGLASSTRGESVGKCLERAGIRECFEVVVTGDVVEHSKPLPDIYLLACSRLGAAPAESYAIEDSPNGIRSAHAAGMHPLMVPDMIAPDEEMRRLSEKIFDSLNDVLAFFQESSGKGK